MSRLPTLGRRGEGWVVLQVLLLGAVALAGTAGPAWDGTLGTLTSAVGVVLVGAGGLLALRGLLDLRGALTPLPHPRDGAELVDTGVYRLARHPIYGGIVVGSLGYGLLMASPPAIAGAVVLLLFFRLKSAREEQWLDDRYAAYAAYRDRTRRMIPWVY